ncbi:MAG: DUF1405 domain-containing protein [Thermobacillus sp.]|uniref:Putative membrane protein n=1 Tax=Thermobacillus composti (strain DSM 18247 / JCM 13945 / KWC4) TaxID=717605 RepID=L0EEB6_THECK|nr:MULTISPECIES: DUF1405 domain-containing protein [Thermobacillus]AGA57959.1 putative membrane protein [Thermobacillus composti KWC4]REK56890.1 MAG: DUF1405 domain-containing protein [Thermobacillus sp.]
MSLTWFTSRAFLLDRRLLWLLFICNALGTAYGYVWYGEQLRWTLGSHPLWRIVFVPDSPTASLFFTIWLVLILMRPERESGFYRIFRIAVEALAVLTLVKYGVWAVVMNAAQGLQGDPLDWQNWMLIASHAAMAVEGLLYARFMRFGRMAALLALGWMLLNDTMDYGVGIYPWLPSVLEDDMTVIAGFTFVLSVVSYFLTLIALQYRSPGEAGAVDRR